MKPLFYQIDLFVCVRVCICMGGSGGGGVLWSYIKSPKYLENLQLNIMIECLKKQSHVGKSIQFNDINCLHNGK